ncbi:MAG: site-2 protease family protein [Deltaproteobacteria bacterium]|nr:site-2 protease family protein [Deltaproteobacteria bacterium]
MASRHGDQTARMLGRLTLNPIPHIDPVGTILLPLILAVSGAPIIGWAKPVPVNPNNLRDPKRDMGIVSAAGPLTNLGLAAICGLILKLAILAFPVEVTPDGVIMSGIGQPVILMLIWGIRINVMLAIFNLLPIPPMDGSKVAISVLPMPYAGWFMRLERYGFLPLMLLFFIPTTNRMIGNIIWPISSALTNFFIEFPAQFF